MKTRIDKLEKKKKIEKRTIRKRRCKKMLIFLLIAIIITIIYMFFVEPKLLKVHEYSIKTSKISSNMHGLKIVHFSDIHYKSTINKDNISKVIAKINILKPDIVVFTGDLIDEDHEYSKKDIEELTFNLSKIEATLGKYAVIGNHDYEANNILFNNIMYDANFKILNNAYELVYKDDNKPILIYGVDDPSQGNPNLEALNNVQENLFRIVLVHEPDYVTNIDTTNNDLVLAGHSHKAQGNIPLIDKIVLPEGARKYYKPYYKINNTDLYISNGLGCVAINARLFSVPSINLYRILKEK